jgi:hypothetical protein
MCRLSWNLGALTSWKPQGLSRPVMGLLYSLTVHKPLNQNVAGHMHKILCVPWWRGLRQFSKRRFTSHSTVWRGCYPENILLISLLSFHQKSLSSFTCIYLRNLYPTLIRLLTVQYLDGLLTANTQPNYSLTHTLGQCFSTAGPRPGTGPWHQLLPDRERFSWKLSF